VSHPLVVHRFDRVLVDVVERLVVDFVDLPPAIVTRCVHAARTTVAPASVSDIPGMAGQVEALARADLGRLQVALSESVGTS
jgi:hypothetical protein